jgi:3-dehydroquinate dehydratase/shikimate dehydrogenase
MSVVMATPSLCVTVTAPTTAELRQRRDAATSADLVELRLDSVSDPDVAGALAGRQRPVIVTCRPTWEGGSFSGSEDERKRLLSAALAAGAEYVDVEARAGFDDLIARTGGKRIVISEHHFDGIPGDLEARVRAMQATTAEVVKLAVQTKQLRDCVTLFDLASQPAGRNNLVLVGIGEHGLATRTLASRFHSKWTYAGGLSSIGQVTPASLIGEFRFRDVGPTTALYGVVGAPVAHSVSPAMHNAAFQAAAIDAVYLPLPAADVDDFVAFARAFDVKGVSVTTPYKVALFNRVDAVSDLATRIGAINTVRMEGGRWVGDNSDVSGFLQPLAGRLPLRDLRAAVLGAGGAARSVAVALSSNGARVSVHARDRLRAADVAALASGSVGEWPPARGSWDLLVNCTPLGMYPHVRQTPLPIECLGGGTVYDLVYNPQQTRLLQEAERAGCSTIGGLEMLVGQARRQFEWWTGVCPQADVMRNAAVKKLGEFVESGLHDENDIV